MQRIPWDGMFGIHAGLTSAQYHPFVVQRHDPLLCLAMHHSVSQMAHTKRWGKQGRKREARLGGRLRMCLQVVRGCEQDPKGDVLQFVRLEG